MPQNPIPGSGTIGWGINANNVYDAAGNTTFPVLDLGSYSSQTLTNGTQTKNYDVPALVDVANDASTGSIVSQGTQAQSIAKSFQEQAQISGGGWGFSAQAAESYGSYSKDTSAYSFFTTYSYQNFFSLKLNNFTSENLSLDFKNNPDYKTLLAEYQSNPDSFTFNKSNRASFYQLLNTFGLYIVESMTMGGYLSFNTITSVKSSLSSSEVTASAQASYDGLFASVSAKASTAWGKVNSSFISDTNVNLYAGGGDTGLISSLALTSLTANQNYNSTYTKWSESCWDNPIVATFELAPLESIFVDMPNFKEAFLNARNTYQSGVTIGSLNMNIDPSQSISLLINENTIDVNFTPLSTSFRYGNLIDYYGPYNQPIYPYPDSKKDTPANNNPQFAWGALAIPRKITSEFNPLDVEQISVNGCPPLALANLYDLISEKKETVPYYAEYSSTIFSNTETNKTVPKDFYTKYGQNPDYLILFYWTGMLTCYLPTGSITPENVFLTQYAPDGDLRNMLTGCGAKLTTNWNDPSNAGAGQMPSGPYTTPWTSYGAATTTPVSGGLLPGKDFVQFFDSPFIYVMLGYSGATKADEFWAMQSSSASTKTLSVNIPLYDINNEYSWLPPF